MTEGFPGPSQSHRFPSSESRTNWNEWTAYKVLWAYEYEAQHSLSRCSCSRSRGTSRAFFEDVGCDLECSIKTGYGAKASVCLCLFASLPFSLIFDQIESYSKHAQRPFFQSIVPSPLIVYSTKAILQTKTVEYFFCSKSMNGCKLWFQQLPQKWLEHIFLQNFKIVQFFVPIFDSTYCSILR